MRTKVGSLLAGLVVAVFLSACATTSAPHPIVGPWLITIDTPFGAMDSNLDVNSDLSGTMSSAELGAARLDSVTVDGERVGFSVDVDAQGQALTLVFNGTVEGDALRGTFNTDFGNIPVTGRRR